MHKGHSIVSTNYLQLADIQEYWREREDSPVDGKGLKTKRNENPFVEKL